MGAFTYIDPTTVRPLAGKILIEIVEVLGGQTKGGIYLPASFQDHSGKDTCYGKILKVGPAPAIFHYKSGPGPGLDVKKNDSGKPWPAEMMEPFQEGNIVVFPRDVPLVFVWEERRFALCYIHEAIVAIDGDSFDPQEFQFVPWTPEEIPL